MAARSGKSRSLISSCRRGGVVQEFLDHTTPSAPLKEASLLLLDVASTPPPAEEGSSLEPVPRLGLRSNLIFNLDTCATHAWHKTFRLWAYRRATAEHSPVANDGSHCHAVNSRLRSKTQPDVGAIGLNGRRIGRYRCKGQACSVVCVNSENIVSDIQALR